MAQDIGLSSREQRFEFAWGHTEKGVFMKKTKLCDVLGIEYPVIQGGMTWISNPQLAAAVSDAGGLGLIVANAGAKPEDNMVENLRRQIRKTRELTSKPFGVNFPLLTTTREQIDVAIGEQVAAVTISAGSPKAYTRYLKGAGVKVLHVVASARHAKKAEAEGVDAVIAEGYEAGGHNGLDELPTLALVPQVVDAVNIPVVAAGGIADARGLVAALALGAQGVQMGTRFVATHECVAHLNFKKRIVETADTGTVITGRKLGPTRALKNEFTSKVLEMESRGASTSELQAFIGFSRSRKGSLEGDLEDGEAYCGVVAGMIKEVMSAAEVIRSMVDGYSRVVAQL